MQRLRWRREGILRATASPHLGGMSSDTATDSLTFVRSSAANTTIEYAVLLAVIVGGLLVASSILGGRLKHAYDDVVALSADRPSSDAVVQMEASDTPSPADVSPNPLAQLSGLRLLAAELIAVVALAGLWYFMHAMRKQREVLGDDSEVPRVFTRSLAPNRIFGKRQKIYRRLANVVGDVLTGPITIEHVMSKNPTSVLTSTSAEDIAEKIEKDRFRHLLVCDRKGKLVGIISDRDVLRKNATTAGEIMTADPISLQPNSLISIAVTLMITKHISCLPVVDEEGRPTAVLTSTDLILALQCMMQILHSSAGDEAASDAESERSQGEAGDWAETSRMDELADGGEPAELDTTEVA